MRIVLAIFAVAVFATTAAAADQKQPDQIPTIDFTAKLVGVAGKPITQAGDDCKPGDVVGKNCSETPMTLGDASIISLEATTDDDRNVDAKKKFERDELARKIYKNAHAALSPDEVSTIKDRIGKVMGAPIVGASWPLLDPTLRK